MCSKSWPLASMYARHQRDTDWQKCSEIQSVSRIVLAAINIRSAKSISELTRVSYRRLLTSLKRKIRGDKSGDVGGQESGLLRPVQLFRNVRFIWSRTNLT